MRRARKERAQHAAMPDLTALVRAYARREYKDMERLQAAVNEALALVRAGSRSAPLLRGLRTYGLQRPGLSWSAWLAWMTSITDVMPVLRAHVWRSLLARMPHDVQEQWLQLLPLAWLQAWSPIERCELLDEVLRLRGASVRLVIPAAALDAGDAVDAVDGTEDGTDGEAESDAERDESDAERVAESDEAGGGGLFDASGQWINRCLECGVDMGPQNPRQLCGKRYCANG